MLHSLNSLLIHGKGEGSKSNACVAFKNKSQEEYYAEVLELKKTLKHMQNNETIAKAKLEYFENEMSRKEQEILALLDYKREESGVSRGRDG